MRKLLSLAAMAVLAFSAQFATAAGYTAGVHYKVLGEPVRTADPAKVEVVEMFGYWCPHCNHLETLIVPWKKTLSEQVLFKPIPVIFRKNQTELAKAFYISEILGVNDKTHQAAFDLIHRQGKTLRDREDSERFFAQFGVSKADFDKAYDSFTLNGLVSNGRKKERAYQITGVPTLIVNGKYVVTAETAGSQPNMLKVVDYLVEQELKTLNP